MKKKRDIGKILLLLLLVFSTTVMASNRLIVKMDGKDKSVRPVPIILDGRPIYSDIPSLSQEGSTLVSIRFIGEFYGSQVNWEGKTKTIIVEQEDKKIVMQIDSKDVYVNGELREIESGYTPKLVKFPNKEYSSTMVPLRFLSDVLEYEVGWDSEKKLPFVNTKKVEEVPEDKEPEDKEPEDKEPEDKEPEDKEPEDKEPEIKEPEVRLPRVKNLKVNLTSTKTPKLTIEGDGLLDYDYEKKGNKFFIHIKNGYFDGPDKDKISVYRSPLREIKIHNDKENNRVSFELDLSRRSHLDVSPSEDKKSIDIYFTNRIKAIDRRIVDGKEVVVINKDYKTKINSLNLRNPDRIVVDFLDSSLSLDESSLPKNIRVSQFSQESLYGKHSRVVRVVLDVEEGKSYSDVELKEEGDRFLIIPKESIKNIFDYDYSGNMSRLKIKLEKNTSYEISQGNESLTISVPKNSIRHTGGGMAINDTLIKDIRIEEKSDKVDIKLNLRPNVDYKNLTEYMHTNIIDLELKKELPVIDTNIDPSKSLIVIDPGHGGRDSGAVSGGVKEKDIALGVSLKVEKFLLEKGYNVVMTRDTDEYIHKYDRAPIANSINADIFVSIHANSVNGVPRANGIETLYKTSLDKKLAQCIQEEIIKASGATNRYLKPRNDLAVLNQTRMPSVLVELGFITNEQERKMMTNNGYQNILARGIVNGIERYLRDR